MPNPRKFFEAHSIIMVSFRTEEGLPFLPLRYINQVFLSALGRAYDLYGVKVCAFSFEANHAHLLLLVEDPEAIPPFVGYIKQESAHAINRLLNRRKRTIWCDGYDSPPLLHSDLALDKFAYVLLNPVKDQLVSSMEQYPGVSSYAMLMEDRHQLVTRRIYRDSIPALNDPHKPWIEEESFRFNLGERENNVTFKLFPYAWKECFPDTKDLSDQQIREKMLDRIGTYKDSLPKVQVNPHRLKRQSLLAQYAPRVFGRRSVCLSRIRELRNNFIATYKKNCAEAVEVFKRWKTGDLAPFPPGLFAPCLPRLANLAPGLTTG